jgi:hypothetical protein
MLFRGLTDIHQPQRGVIFKHRATPDVHVDRGIGA